MILLYLMRLILLLLLLISTFGEGKRKKIHKRVGFRADPEGLQVAVKAAPFYISYNTFSRAFVRTRGLFAPKAPIPGNETYSLMMHTLIESPLLDNKSQLADFLGYIFWTSKGLTVKEWPQTTLSIPSFHARGYAGISGPEAYRSLSQRLYGDDRLAIAPELLLIDERVNWRASLLYWNTKDKNPNQSVQKITKILKSYFQSSNSTNNKA